MVVAANVPVNTYVGAGSTGTFPFTFPVFSQSELLVSVVSTVAGSTPTVLVLGTDYSVTGLNASGDPASTGNVVLIAASQAWMTGANLSTGYNITVEINVALEQTTSIRNQGDFYRSALENALDKLEMQIQQLQVAITALQVGGTVTQAPLVITDLSNGHTYQVVTVNGVLGTLQLT